MAKPCKHREKRRLYAQKMMRKEMKDAVVGSLSVTTFEAAAQVEDPQEDWLNDYLNTPTRDLGHWQRREYKPEKYNTPQKMTPGSARFHRCEKHGLIPLAIKENGVYSQQPQLFTGSGRSDSRMTTYTFPRYEGPGINFAECIAKMIEGIKKLIELSNRYPRIASIILAILFFWWLSYQLQGWLTHGAAGLVRVGRPAAHWSSVSLEQFGNRIRSFASAADDLIEGFYCDFSRSWCNRFELMCDVRCSFMDKAIQRLRTPS